jgi:hypothetical protein
MYVIGDLDPSHKATKSCPPLTDWEVILNESKSTHNW